jgi:predicted RNA-binding protein Jag
MRPTQTAQPVAHEVPVFTQIALEQALHSGRCLSCVAVHASERKSIHAFLYEGMMSLGVRQDFRRKGGFCRRHFWMANQIEEDCWQTGGIGLAILCEDLLRLANDIPDENAGPSRKNKRLIGRRSEPVAITIGSRCIFCEENATRESYLIEILEALIGEPQFHRILEDRPLCVAHGRMAATKWKSAENRASIANALRTYLQRLAAEMRIFIDKHDHQRRNELREEQSGVLQYAIDALVGFDHSAYQEREHP